MGLSTTYTKTETDFLLQQIDKKVVEGYKGDLRISDHAPTEIGYYILLEVGTYTNLGGIVVSNNNLNFASFDGTTWSKVEVDAAFEINGMASDNLIALAKKINGYYIDHSNGNIVSESLYTTTEYIELSPDTIYIYGNYFTNSNFAFYDKDKNFIPNNSSIVRIFGFKTPENAKYIRLSYLTANEKNVFLVRKDIEVSNKWDNLIKNLTSGYYIDQNSGGVQPASGFLFTDFIRIKPNRWFKINPNSYQQFAFYDENLQYISDNSSDNNLKAFKSPYNAEYIRMTVRGNEVSYNYLIMLSEEIEDNIIRVSKKYGDFDKINDAVQFAHNLWPRRFTIKIANGVYEEEIIANQGIGHSLIADSKYEVIVCDVNDTDKKWETLKVKSGYYFEGIYFKRNGGGYAVHADYGGTSADTEFFNCRIESAYGSAVGYGQQQDQVVKFRNCQIIQRSAPASTGILYMHDAVDKNITGGSIEFWHCEVDGFDRIVRIDDANQIYGDGQGALGRFKPLFVGNNFRSKNYGKQLDLRNGGKPTASGAIIGNIVIDERSYGNNVSELNK